MTASAGSPELRRKRLGALLRRERIRQNMTGAAVAEAVGWSASKVSRYERGDAPSMPVGEVEKLLDFYYITGPTRADLLELARDGAPTGWWHQNPDIQDPARQVISLEHEAPEIWIWAPVSFPALLQTPAYARALLTGYGQIRRMPPSAVERSVQATMRRQEILNHTQVRVVLDESCLTRQVGGDRAGEVMTGQIAGLAALAGQDNISIRVLTLDADHPVMTSGFTLFRLDGPGDAIPDVVAVQHLGTICLIEDERDAYLHRLTFEALAGHAVDEAFSLALIQKAFTQLAQ